jgi:uncharacterized membrane protein (DUF485 family)
MFKKQKKTALASMNTFLILIKKIIFIETMKNFLQNYLADKISISSTKYKYITSVLHIVYTVQLLTCSVLEESS